MEVFGQPSTTRSLGSSEERGELKECGNNEKGETDHLLLQNKNSQSTAAVALAPGYWATVVDDGVSSPTRLSSFESQTSETSVLSRKWSEYNAVLDEKPLLVKSVTAFFVLALGDAVAQGLELVVRASTEETASSTTTADYYWDIPRTLRFGAFGILGAPWGHYYYHTLDSILPPTVDPFTCTTVVKVVIDQFLQAPLLLGFIIVGLDVMQAASFKAIREDLEDHYWNTLVANWKLWLPASFLNLAFVKPKHRVLFVNVVFFIWTIILSFLLNS